MGIDAVNRVSKSILDPRWPAIWSPIVAAEIALTINGMQIDTVQGMCYLLDVPISKTRRECAVALTPVILNYYRRLKEN